MANASKKHMGSGMQGKGDGTGALTELPEGILEENMVLSNRDKSQSLFECDYLAASWTGIGLSRASMPDRVAANAMRAAETSRRPARSRSSPPQCTSQPKLRSTTQRPASTTKPF